MASFRFFKRQRKRTFLIPETICLLLLFAGCSPEDTQLQPTVKDLIPVKLQTDWFAQAEHGGYYQAKAKGYYREAGLDVEILEGGIHFMGALRVTRGKVDFAIHKADAIISHVAEGMPLKMVAAIFQHDPQGLMMHLSNPVENFIDLDGKNIVAMPGAHWIAFLEKRYGIRLNILPHDKGMQRFLADPEAIQQCMVTNEPFFAEKAGVPTKTLLLAESGFDPYHVLYTHAGTVESQSEMVAAFVRATLKGWYDYLYGDPSPAHQMILQRNESQTEELLDYSRQTMLKHGFIAQDAKTHADLGKLDPARLEELSDMMLELGLLDRRMEVEEYADFQFLQIVGTGNP